MQKRIVGQRPAVGTRCTMLSTPTSRAQQLKRQICSLWYSILISESLPLVTLVWRAVMARVSPQKIGIGSELVDDADCHYLLGFAKKDSKKHRANIVSRAFPQRTEAASSSHSFFVEVVVQSITAQKSELLEAPSWKSALSLCFGKHGHEMILILTPLKMNVWNPKIDVLERKIPKGHFQIH